MIQSKIAKLMQLRKDYLSERAVEFYTYISDLIVKDEVLELDNYIQHHGYTRLRHSLDVAYYSFVLARMFGWDARSTARGALLHDLYHYDARDDDYAQKAKGHAVSHPKLALSNARKICALNKVEEDIIVKHMWLITLTPPRYREGFIVTFVDKYCAVKEFMIGFMSKDKQPRSLFASQELDTPQLTGN